MLKGFIKNFSFVILSFSALYSNAISTATNTITQTQTSTQTTREEVTKSIFKKDTNIILDEKRTFKQALLKDESPCFRIDKIKLYGNESKKFQIYLDRALKELKFKRGICLGSQSINAIYSTFSNNIIKAGYITTSIQIPSQNLNSKTLKFNVSAGKIDKIYINKTDSVKNRATKFTAFGYLEDKLLNLRDIEQGLENITNASVSQVDIELIPSKNVSYTDVYIDKDEKFPVKFNLSFDNLGSAATGKYQGGLSAHSLNLLGFNEMFYVSYTRNIFKGNEERVEDESKRGKSHNYYYGFSIPYKYFLLDFNENRYTYAQAIPGAYSVYKYSGESLTRNLNLSYLYLRNQFSKNSIYLKFWEKESKNYIQDYELDNQSRKTSGYEVGLSSQIFLKNSTIKVAGAYKKATGARGAITMQEDDDENTRLEIITFDLAFQTYINNLPLAYDISLHAQFNQTPLVVQDRLSIGGKYTVRGFDGEMSLVGNRGYYIRNTLEYSYDVKHGVYVAFDVGRVSGLSSEYLSGQTLVGSGIGFKGNFTPHGTLGYDLLAGFAINKPSYFKTDDVALNFSLNYSF
ncbi:ShlB/FhaC/HecB family hemolysin secretion/activation protein [Campylobacter geochelonis]|uniref:ShlB/FhaC/HecB family hemolysin secretion/activation protein n=1 Tax=Campylobacter geochelonis TaxID=1780362 RepID=UPI000770928B|nr:ShlB/FhaC/HecB family hemolysin secretion/activation protein [Campylobacter geochelonis]CZE49738.1 putative hemolysin activation protein HecB [Campylobacter geochelonis]